MADDDDSSGWASSTSSTGPDSPTSDRSKKLKAGARSAGSSLSSYGAAETERAAETRITPVSYRKGGRVRKTGIARLHRGEVVVPRGKAKRAKKAIREMSGRR